MPWLTLEQNILFGADKKKYSKNQLKERAEGLLKLTGLEKFGNAYPDQLSGGMMQRAALGRALACDASYLLMDEPLQPWIILQDRPCKRSFYGSVQRKGWGHYLSPTA